MPIKELEELASKPQCLTLKEFEREGRKTIVYALVEKEPKEDVSKDMEIPTPIRDIF